MILHCFHSNPDQHQQSVGAPTILIHNFVTTFKRHQNTHLIKQALG